MVIMGVSWLLMNLQTDLKVIGELTLHALQRVE